MKLLPRLEMECSIWIPRKDQIETATGKAYVKIALFNSGIRAGTVLLSGLRPSRERIRSGRFIRFRSFESCQYT